MYNCIVLENQKNVLADLVSALGAVNITIRAAHSVADVLRLVADSCPDAIFARLHLEEQEGAGVELINQLSRSSRTSGLPVVALFYSTENDEELLGKFAARLPLPVAFPNFSKRASALLEELMVQAADAQQHVEVVDESAAGVYSGATTSARTGVGSAIERRMVIAYAIHMEVLEALKTDGEFAAASLSEIPAVVGKVTEQVVREFKLSRLVD